MNFSINDIIVDFVSTFGKEYVLVDVVAKSIYKDGNKTDDVIYNYDICCLDRKMKHVNVKISGKQLLSAPESGNIARVELVEPIAKPYFMNGQVGFTVNATSIKEVK